jgi:sterol desaturase/sphingolipid hydroxylase (fatty acid hydroxylase superfamily)
MTAIPWGVSGAQARAIKVAWVGVLAISAFWAWLAVVGESYLSQTGQLWSAITNGQALNVGPALVITVLVLLAAEQRWPAVRRPLFSRAHIVDAGYLLLFAVAAMPVITLAANGLSLEIGRHASFLVLSYLPFLPSLVAVVVILVATDGMLWAAHVANHRFETLWRLHALHHSQEDMSVLTTFRTHPLIHATYLPALLPALLLEANGTVPRAALIVYGCLVTLPHANLRWRLGPLGRVIVSPAYHRIHHARDLGPRGTVNFGFVLVMWDWLARRAEFPTGGEPIATGIAGRTVPLEQVQARPSHLPLVFLAQLVQPFRRFSTTDWRR